MKSDIEDVSWCWNDFSFHERPMTWNDQNRDWASSDVIVEWSVSVQICLLMLSSMQKITKWFIPNVKGAFTWDGIVQCGTIPSWVKGPLEHVHTFRTPWIFCSGRLIVIPHEIRTKCEDLVEDLGA